MTLEELLYELSTLELASLALSNDGDGTIRRRDLNKLVVAINSGLRELTERFIYRVETVEIEITDTQEYELPEKCYQVLNVASNSDRLLPVNDEELTLSVHLVNQDTIITPMLKEGSTLKIWYQPMPKRVCLDEVRESLDLPDLLITPLKLFVASTIYSSIGGTDSDKKAESYANKYAGLVNQLLGAGAFDRNRYMNHRFHDGGWV